ncbi:MAG: hypothetical protein RRY12_02640 [Cloacibacillus sp.]
MLNELYPAGVNPAFKNIATQEWDQRLKPMAKGDLYKITLCVGSPCVDGITRIKAENAAGLRKYEESNGFSFPGFNLPPSVPLEINEFIRGYILARFPEENAMLNTIPEKQRPKYLLQKFKTTFDAQSLRQAIYNAPSGADAAMPQYREKVTAKVKKCIKDTAANLWQQIKPEDAEGRCSSYCTLHERIEKINAEQFMDAVFTFALSRIESFEDWEFYSPLLFLTKPISSTIPSEMVYLDIMDYGPEGNSVAHRNTVGWINRRLLAASKAPEADELPKARDAFNNPAYKMNEKMPSVRVPVLGDVILRSMVKEAPCQLRYGVADYESFPMGDESRRSAKLALESLSQDDLKGKTWDVMGDKELLFAYPRLIPKEVVDEDEYDEVMSFDASPTTAAMTGNDFETDRATFEELSKQVIETLQGRCRSISEIEILIFAIKKMDKARTKVVYYTNFSAEQFMHAAEEWTAACKNLPDKLLVMRDWGDSKGEVVISHMRAIFPKEFALYANKVWRQNGTEYSPSKRVDPLEGLVLLLKEKETGYLNNLLSIFMSNTAPFFAHLGESMHRGVILSGKKGGDKIANPAILALLLYKLGCKKEDYMNSSIFKIGTLLALADSLQYQYCKYIRTPKDARSKTVNVPMQLVGNAMLAEAELHPREVIGTLGQRIRPYLTWSKTDQDEDWRLSRWLDRQFNTISKELDYDSLPTSRLNPEETAQLYLGYMAGCSVKSEKENDTSDPQVNLEANISKGGLENE